MAPPEEGFSEGDQVTVLDMPELAGAVCTLLRPLGKRMWSVKVPSDDKSKAVPVDKLRKLNIKGQSHDDGPTPPAKYSIVGTWDDWEPRAMAWNIYGSCFEACATIGTDGSESFKILKNGDWDGCVYPDRKDACPFDDHKVHGPDDGGLNEEWTIGYHANDKACVGSQYKIRMTVDPRGTPLKVTWEPAGAQQETKHAEAETLESPQEGGAAAAPEAAVNQVHLRWGNPYTDDSLFTAVAARGHIMDQNDWLQKNAAARERLAERLQRALEANPLAIEDENEHKNYLRDVAEADRINMLTQVQINLDRYSASNREPPKVDEEDKKVPILMCGSCGRIRAVGPGNGICERCWTKFEQVKEKDPQDVVITDDMPAGLRLYYRMQKSQLNRA
eukprot:CAMPEP_0171109644 /NCGR_PEP_ID=MMETSP0766_2-20121228/70899_1 /TAXON_ID=439317 /ORGANISM="Gambierdiscus australes, Strain CAWD 149" /LENGTH=388 /DNA_ID=CAMNT_0011571411 /DNA_START=55 /DNA_END=1221 /DNA_ORIENTATION=+